MAIGQSGSEPSSSRSVAPLGGSAAASRLPTGKTAKVNQNSSLHQGEAQGQARSASVAERFDPRGRRFASREYRFAWRRGRFASREGRFAGRDNQFARGGGGIAPASQAWRRPG